MITIRPAAERGHADLGWLDSWHTFSFADYFDPQHTGFRTLRVINDDRIKPNHGFSMHGHRDMEIISYVIDGQLAHADNMGNGATLSRGDVQTMTAGRGVMHSEKNPSATDTGHFLQIWIFPRERGLPPSYADKHFGDAEKRGRLRVIVSPDGRDGSLTINQDAILLATLLEPGESVEHVLQPGRHAWVQVAAGAVSLNGHSLNTGDGAAISDETTLALHALDSAEVLVFDLP